jgi:hypothetical protein
VDRPGLRLGILIGVLAASVVALGAVVAIPLSDDDDPAVTTTSAETQSESEPCEQSFVGGQAEVEVDLGSSGLNCDEAKAIYADWEAALDAGEGVGSGGFVQVGEWECHSWPFADYPRLAACESGSRSFQLVGTAPAAH